MLFLLQRYAGEKRCRHGTDEGPRAERNFYHQCHSSTSSRCNYVQAHRHVAAEMDEYLFAYSLSQQIIGSVVA